MSVYATIFTIGQEHKKSCARMECTKHANVWVYHPEHACTCGVSPLVYCGSHEVPSTSDIRDGGLSLAKIPGNISRDGSKKRKRPHPYLRVTVHEGDYLAPMSTVVLTAKQAAQLRDALADWLKEVQP